MNHGYVGYKTTYILEKLKISQTTPHSLKNVEMFNRMILGQKMKLLSTIH